MANALINAQKETKKLMPSLHKACGFDFCKPYAVAEFDGRFTENKIRRMMAETMLEGESVTPMSHRIIVLTKGGRYVNSDTWHLVEILRSKVKIDIRSEYSYRDSFDYFYAKSRFDEFRKSDNCHTIVVAQNLKYCRIPARKSLDLSERLNIMGFNYCRDYRTNRRYISSLDIKDPYTRNRVCSYVHGIITEDEGEIIDKSGYLLYTRRDELKQRVVKRRSEMLKAIADSTDFSEHVITLTNLVAYKKGVLIERLKNCNTYEDYRNFDKDFSYFDGFVGIVNDFERYCRDVNEKRFSSVESENRFYNSLVTKLTK